MNYIVDPYRVFSTNIFRHEVDLNDRFAKIELLRHEHQRFNSYILGSSRALGIDPHRLEQYFPESTFYNLAVTKGIQRDNLKHLEYFMARQYVVRNLYVQIDVDFLSEKIAATEYGRQLHPDVIHQSKLLMYMEYLTILPMKQIQDKIRVNLRNKPKNMDYEMDDTGMFLTTEKENRIRKNPARYINQETSFHQKPERMKYADISANIAALKAFKGLCDAAHIRCLFFTTPLHHVAMDSLNLRNYLDSLRAISEITTFYDFTGYNTVTLDDHNYYEASHYRPHVADLIVARIFGDSRIAVPEDFGVLITPETVDARLRRVLRQIEQRDRAREIPGTEDVTP